MPLHWNTSFTFCPKRFRFKKIPRFPKRLSSPPRTCPGGSPGAGRKGSAALHRRCSRKAPPAQPGSPHGPLLPWQTGTCTSPRHRAGLLLGHVPGELPHHLLPCSGRRYRRAALAGTRKPGCSSDRKINCRFYRPGSPLRHQFCTWWSRTLPIRNWMQPRQSPDSTGIVHPPRTGQCQPMSMTYWLNNRLPGSCSAPQSLERNGSWYTGHPPGRKALPTLDRIPGLRG